MSSEVFHFKQFDVRHDRSSMRVGTDGVLLGAWAGSAQLLSLTTHPLVLDIGTGCGLITLMLAQRFPAMHITGIDIDLDSIEQARENVTAGIMHGIRPHLLLSNSSQMLTGYCVLTECSM